MINEPTKDAASEKTNNKRSTFVNVMFLNDKLTKKISDHSFLL
jgi:hypothetical protein